MNRPQFLTDEDFKEEIVSGVRRLDPSVRFLSVRDADLASRPDSEILAYAAAQRLIILSHDANTMTKYAYERLSKGNEMAGLFIVQQREPIGPVINSIAMIALASDADEWRGQVVFLPA